MTGVSGNNRNTPPHWDIALLGLWWSCNYGAVLTSFSLHCVLSRQGYRVLLLDHAPMTMASPMLMILVPYSARFSGRKE